MHQCCSTLIVQNQLTDSLQGVCLPIREVVLACKHITTDKILKLFLLYGFYRAVNRPAMSVVLTVISLGTRVVLAYALSAIPAIGVTGIWAAVPIGWALADITGIVYYRKYRRKLLGPAVVSAQA